MSITIMRNDRHSTRSDGGRQVPFAALPHELAQDPRLSPTAKAVLLALTWWARDKDSCWPSDASIGQRVGRHPGTVQRVLRSLQVLGIIERRPDTSNPTGRVIALKWKGPVERPRSTPPAPARVDPAAPARDELEGQGERERAAAAVGPGEGPPPPPEKGRGGPVAVTAPAADDLAELRAWAAGPDRALARAARSVLNRIDAAVSEAPPPVEATVAPVAPALPADPVGTRVGPRVPALRPVTRGPSPGPVPVRPTGRRSGPSRPVRSLYGPYPLGEILTRPPGPFR